MALRVTQGMIQEQLLRNLTRNYGKMSNDQNILSTGKKINKPSDDPVGITYALRYRSELNMNDQYQRNVDFATSSLDHTDTVLGQVNDVMQRAQELATQALNGTNPQTALDAINEEIKQLYDQAVGLGNDQMNGKYIFNGQLTNKKPYDPAIAETQSSDDQGFDLQFSAGVNIQINVTGNDVFGTATDTDNLFKTLKDMSTALQTNDMALLNTCTDNLHTRYDKFLQVRAEVGARANRVEMLDSRLKDLNINLNTLSGKTEDADMADMITKLSIDQNVYQASLSVGAKIIQPSLIDFLR